VFEVADDGVGDTPAAAPAGPGRRSLGHQLIRSLARQLGGEPERVEGAGTRVRVTIDAGRFGPCPSAADSVVAAQ
jgi:two-component sensor histidine kinase